MFTFTADTSYSPFFVICLCLMTIVLEVYKPKDSFMLLSLSQLSVCLFIFTVTLVSEIIGLNWEGITNYPIVFQLKYLGNISSNSYYLMSIVW